MSFCAATEAMLDAPFDRDLGDRTIVPELIRLLDNTDYRVRAAQALGTLQDRRAFGPLCRTLTGTDISMLDAAMYALGMLDLPEAIPHIRPFVKHDSVVVAESAVMALAKLKDPANRAELESFLLDEIPGAQNADEHSERNDLVYQYADMFGTEGADLLFRAASASNDDDFEYCCIEVLSRVGDRRALDLLPPTWEEDDTLQWIGCLVVGNLKHRPAVPALIQIAETGEPEGSTSAIVALGEIGDTTAVEPLQKLFEHPPSWGEGLSLAVALRALGAPPEIRRIMGRILTIGNDLLVFEAMNVLTTFGDPQFVAMARSATTQRAWHVRKAAIEALVSMKDAELATYVEPLRSDRHWEVQAAAEKALAGPSSSDPS